MAGYLRGTGHIYPELERRFPDSPYKSPLLLYRNLGTVILRSCSMRPAARFWSRIRAGIAYGDFDNDGDIDMLVVNLGEPLPLTGTTFQERATGSRSGWRHSLQSHCDRRARRDYGKRKEADEGVASSPVFSLATTSGFISDWGSNRRPMSLCAGPTDTVRPCRTQGGSALHHQGRSGIVPNRGWK